MDFILNARWNAILEVADMLNLAGPTDTSRSPPYKNFVSPWAFVPRAS